MTMAMASTASNQNECPFAEGDRVQDRFGWPADGVKTPHELLKRLGTIVRVQRGLPNGRGQHGWSIAVRWDGSTTVARGYTGATLVRVFVPPPIMMLLGSATDTGDHQS